MSVKIVNFGCRLNSSEAEIIKQKAEQAALHELPQGAFIFNTCAVTAEAVRQAKQSIRKIRRENPESRIIVTGCAAQTQGQDFADMDAVDLVLGNEDKMHPHSYRSLPDFGVNHYEKLRVNDIMSIHDTAGHLINALEDKTRAFIQVQNGCDHRCTFCIIPYGRGPSRSVPMGSIVEQIKKLRQTNIQEVILTGVDLTSYGPDLPGAPTLGLLVQNILKQVPDLPRLRLSSLDSVEVDPLLKELIMYEKRLMPHLHLSLQSGNNLILKRMKRRHQREESVQFCQELKQKRPALTFGADLIAGFPTETREMFQDSLKLIEDCHLTFVHVFPYSARPQTPAARMPQIQKAEIKNRAKQLRIVAQTAYQKHLQMQIGQHHTVLIEKNNFGHAENYMPVELTKPQKENTLVLCKIINSHIDKLIAEPI